MVLWNSLCFTLGALFLRFAANQGPSTDPNANAISDFFGRLTADLTVFALAMAGFFFALSALFYMASGATQNERTRQHAISALYAALGGLALALLAGTVALLINNAATGSFAGGPAN